MPTRVNPFIREPIGTPLNCQGIKLLFFTSEGSFLLLTLDLAKMIEIYRPPPPPPPREAIPDAQEKHTERVYRKKGGGDLEKWSIQIAMIIRVQAVG